MQALTALVELFRYFVSWAPYPLKVLTKQRAVKFRTVSWYLIMRKIWWQEFRWWTSPVPKPEQLEPGFYWYIPAVTEILVLSSVDDFYQIPARYAIAGDGKTVSVQSVLTCKITGFIFAATRCELVGEAIISQGILAQTEVVAECRNTAARGLNDQLLSRAAAGLEKYGVTVQAAAIEVGATQIRHHVGLGETFPEAEL